MSLATSNPKISEWENKKVWLVGASSGIGAALATLLIKHGAIVAVSARRNAPLDALIISATKGSRSLAFDVTDSEAVADACHQLLDDWQHIDLVIWLAGTYQPMQADSFDLPRAKLTVQANVMGPINGLAALLPALLSERCAGIAFVSSVAGYRGLPRSLIYGPTKAALTNLAESLYLDLHDRGVGVWVINPGFVKTTLTDKNEFKMPALIEPEQAAQAILKGFASGRFEIHFPKRFTRMLKFMRTWPYRAYFAAIRKATMP